MSGSQTFSGTATVFPAPFTHVAVADFCLRNNAPISYQYQVSTDNSNRSIITAAAATTYNIPDGYSGRKYYRSCAVQGSSTAYSNTLTVDAEVPQGDPAMYGNESWIGYVYKRVNNYTDYITEPVIFNEGFGGSQVNMPTAGCDVYTDQFTVRFRMRKTFECGEYVFTVGGMMVTV